MRKQFKFLLCVSLISALIAFKVSPGESIANTGPPDKAYHVDVVKYEATDVQFLADVATEPLILPATSVLVNYAADVLKTNKTSLSSREVDERSCRYRLFDHETYYRSLIKPKQPPLYLT